MFGFKCVTESSSVFFKYESVSRDLVLLLTSFIAENVCSHLHVVPKRHIKFWANFLSSGKFSHGNDRQKLIMSETFGTEESSWNFVFNDEFVLKSISSICILLGNFIIFCSLSENGFVKASMQYSSLTKSWKRLSNDSCNNLIFSVYFAKLPLSAAHVKGRLHYEIQSFLVWSINNIFNWKQTNAKEVNICYKVWARNKKITKIMSRLTLLLSQECNAPLLIMQCATFGACAIGRPPLI